MQNSKPVSVVDCAARHINLDRVFANEIEMLRKRVQQLEADNKDLDDRVRDLEQGVSQEG